MGSLLPLSNSRIGFKPSLRCIFCERKSPKTLAESVEDIVAASSKAIGKLRCIGNEGESVPSQYRKPPKKSVVSKTPTVESIIPGPSIGRISCTFVSKPPEKRITARATVPTNCVRRVSLYSRPSPAEPKSIPVIRKTSSAGTPNLVPTLPAKRPASIRTEPPRSMKSDVFIYCLFHQVMKDIF